MQYVYIKIVIYIDGIVIFCWQSELAPVCRGNSFCRGRSLAISMQATKPVTAAGFPQLLLVKRIQAKART